MRLVFGDPLAHVLATGFERFSTFGVQVRPNLGHFSQALFCKLVDDMP